MAEAVLKLKARTLTRIELDDLSKHFFPLARNIARRFAPRGREDDYFSAGYFGIAYALVNAADKMVDDDLESWVKSCIYSQVRRHRVTDHIVCIPDSTLRDARDRGEEPELMKKHVLCDDTHVPRKTSRYQELLDQLERAAVDSTERRIIELRLEGYTDTEIADILGKSKSDIHRRRVRMEVRFDTIMEKP